MSVLPASCVKNCIPGEDSDVLMGKETYKGKVTASGRSCDYSCMCDGLTKYQQ